MIYHNSKPLTDIVESYATCKTICYDHFSYNKNGFELDNKSYPVQFFGKHNFSNMKAAFEVCKQLGVSNEEFAEAMPNFQTPDKRLNMLLETNSITVIRDFAHAPSKVKSTVSAVKEQYSEYNIRVLLELHTYSSLNIDFMQEYAGTFTGLQDVVVSYNPQTLVIKKMPAISEATIREKFDHDGIKLMTTKDDIENWLFDVNEPDEKKLILIMSSGHLGGISFSEIIDKLSQLNT